MGWASYLEKIIELREEAIALRDALERSPEPLSAAELQSIADEANRRIEIYRRLLPQFISHIDQLLEYATDPAMSLAEEVRQLRRERDSKLTEVGELRTKRNSEAAQLQRLRADLDAETRKLNRVHASADLRVADLRKKLNAGDLAYSNAVKSTKGELAKQKELYERKMEEVEKRHKKELVIAKLGSRIAAAANKAEKGDRQDKETSGGQSTKQEDFATFLQNYSSPRVSISSQHQRKQHPKTVSRSKK